MEHLIGGLNLDFIMGCMLRSVFLMPFDQSA